MFLPVGTPETKITVFLDGRPLAARIGETVAACLLRARVPYFRKTPVNGAARLPYCMIGHCFDCLIEIEGIGSRQACLLQVQAGMKLRIQRGPAALDGIERQEEEVR